MSAACYNCVEATAFFKWGICEIQGDTGEKYFVTLSNPSDTNSFVVSLDQTDILEMETPIQTTTKTPGPPPWLYGTSPQKEPIQVSSVTNIGVYSGPGNDLRVQYQHYTRLV